MYLPQNMEFMRGNNYNFFLWNNGKYFTKKGRKCYDKWKYLFMEIKPKTSVLSMNLSWKKYVIVTHGDCIAEIGKDLKDGTIYITVYETTDTLGRCIVEVIIGRLFEDGLTKSKSSSWIRKKFLKTIRKNRMEKV